MNISIYYGTSSIIINYYKNENENEKNELENDNKILKTVKYPSTCKYEENKLVITDKVNNEDILQGKYIINSKRLLGLKVSDPSIKDELKQWPFNVIADEYDNPIIQLKYDKNIQFTPEELLSTYIKETNDEIDSIIVPVSSCFSSSQRQSYYKATQLCDIKNCTLLNETTSAALAFANRNGDCITKATLLIYNFGGIAFDVAIVQVEGKTITTLAVGGDNRLGGEDITNNLVNYYAELLNEATHENIFDKTDDLILLRHACEEAKIQYTGSGSATVEYPPLTEYKIDNSLKGNLFDKINEELFIRSVDIVEKTIEESKKKNTDIDCIVLVGGSTVIQNIQRLLQKFEIDMFRDGDAIPYGLRAYPYDYDIKEVLAYDMGISATKINKQDKLPSDIEWITKKLTPLPCTNTKRYSIDAGKTLLTLYIYERIGEYDKHNTYCNAIVLSLLKPLPSKLNVVLEFSFDINGLLTVTSTNNLCSCNIY